MKNKKILIVSHDGTRSGAPILLLNLITILRELPDIHIEVLIRDKKSGSLYQKFKELAPTEFLYNKTKRFDLSVFKKYLTFDFNKNRQVSDYFSSFDVILSNTVTNGEMHHLLSKHPNVITYIHELEESIQKYTTPEKLHNVLLHSALFLYPSVSVKENLIIRHAVAADKLIYFPAYIPDAYYDAISKRTAFRKSLNISDETFVVIGVGGNHWTKGPDYFVQTILFAKQMDLPVKAIWLGSDKSSIEHRRLLYDIDKMGLTDVIMLLEPSNDVSSYLSAADLFFLSSREDAYPLVMIEAAMMRLPLIYFKGSGGAAEFIAHDAGFEIEYARTDLACDKIAQLIQHKDLCSSLGSVARKKYEALHSKEKVLRQFNNLIERVI